VSTTKAAALEKIKQELIKRKIELEQELKRLSQEPVVDDQVQDPGDQALSSTMEALQSSLQDTELGEYNRIVRALEKIDDGSYGVCLDCGTAILEKRLKSYPDAARCLSCQEILEEKGPGQ
jgi:DnaK suppressor protein